MSHEPGSANYAPNPPLLPVQNLGHELGVLFAFSAFMVLSLVAYWIGWNRTSCSPEPPSNVAGASPAGVLIQGRKIGYQKRIEQVERDRQTQLAGTPLYKGFTDEKTEVADRERNAMGTTEIQDHA